MSNAEKPPIAAKIDSAGPNWVDANQSEAIETSQADKLSAQSSQAKVQSTQQQKIDSPFDRTLAPEYGGPKGKDPTRYGDWEKNGRCIDF